VGSSFVIEDNPELQTIGSFTSLSDVNRHFIIKNCQQLREVTGFGSLSIIGTYVSHPNVGTDRFQIINNPALENVEGFCSLETITGDFRIESNPNLTISENIFKNLEDVKRNYILTNNTNFNDCCILSCIDVENITDNQVTINSNGGNCSSMENIIMNCGQTDCETFCIEDVDVCCVCDGVGAATWYLDSDGDGLGNSEISVISCDQPVGFVDNGDDDDDNDNPVSIADSHLENQITIFPNPTTTQITIQHPTTSTPTQIHLLDLNGRHLLTTQSATGDTQLDLSTLPEGIYFVHLVNENYNAVRKVLKSGR